MNFKGKIIISALFFTGLGLFYLQACTEKKYIVQSGTIELTGLVLACYCDPCGSGWDPNPEYETRYSVVTGKEAMVSFVAQSGNMCSISTDDSSGYSIFLDSGIYNIIVETGHSYPDTLLNVPIQKDTAINLSIEFAWLVDDTVWINFRYENVIDTIGMSGEIYDLKKLNYLIGGGFQEVFDIREVKTYDFIDDTITYVIYSIPVNPDRYLWEVFERSFKLMQTPDIGFPAGMSIWYAAYICQDN